MYNLILKHCHFNVIRDLQKYSVHFMDDFVRETMTRFRAVAGSKNFFNSKLYSVFVERFFSFSALSGDRIGGFWF